MFNKTKFAITWAELILIALLVVGGIGVWFYIVDQVAVNMKTQEPVEAFVTETTDVITNKAELAAAQVEFTALQDELIKQRVSLQHITAQIAALQSAYPSLSNLPTINVFSPEVFNAYWDAQLNAQTLVNQTSKLDSKIGILIDQKAQSTLDLKKLTLDTQEYLVALEKQTYIDSQLTAAKEKVTALKFDLEQQQSFINAIETLHPGLDKYSLANQAIQYPSSDILQKYLDALSSKNEIEAGIVSLYSRVTTKKAELVSMSTTLTESQKRAHSIYLTAQKEFAEKKDAETLKQSALWLGVYLLAALLIYGSLAFVMKSLSSFIVALSFTIAALLELLAYLQFKVMGAALVGLGVFVILLGIIAIANRQSKKGGLI